MTGAVLILRPQPGAEETADRARRRGLATVVAPLFTVRPVDWTPPPADLYDAVLLTSANAPRHAGPALGAFTGLPCYCVGESTAAAARAAGFDRISVGPSNAVAVVAMMEADGIAHAFHPTTVDPPFHPSSSIRIDQVAVYAPHAAEYLPDLVIPAINAGAIVLLHSPRGASELADRIGDRRRITRIAAISDAAAAAAGTGWAAVTVALEPRDEALLDAAEELAGVGRAAEVPATATLADIEDAEAETAEEEAPRRRSLGAMLMLPLIAFLAGIAIFAWTLRSWEGSAEWLGLAAVPAEAPAAAQSDQPPADPSQNGALPSPAPTPATSLPTVPIDPATGQPAQGDVAARLVAIEQRIGAIDVDSRSAVGNSDRAEGLLVAFAARRALDRGVGLGYIEGLLRQRFGTTQPQAVGTIIAAAREPVTLQALQEGLQLVGPQLAGTADRTFLEAIGEELENLVIIRREGTAVTDPAERLRRATARLDAGQVDLALAEVLRMPGAANGRAWVDAARRYVAARQALDQIEFAALLEPRMPAAQGQAQPEPAQPAR